MRGAGARTAALLEGKADLVVLSRFAADQLIAEHPVELVAELGPATYVGAHGMLLRHGADSTPPDCGWRSTTPPRICGCWSSGSSQAARTWSGAKRPYMQLRDLFARDEVDATVWNLDEVQDRIGLGVARAARSATRSPASWRCATPARRDHRPDRRGEALAAVRESLDLSLVTRLQTEVLRGERVPSY